MLKIKVTKKRTIKPETNETELFTISETCVMLRISRKMLDQAIRADKIKVTRFGIKKMFVHGNEIIRIKLEGFK